MVVEAGRRGMNDWLRARPALPFRDIRRVWWWKGEGEEGLGERNRSTLETSIVRVLEEAEFAMEVWAKYVSRPPPSRTNCCPMGGSISGPPNALVCFRGPLWPDLCVEQASRQAFCRTKSRGRSRLRLLVPMGGRPDGPHSEEEGHAIPHSE